MILDKNSKYIYLYLTREYKNNSPLNENEIGIGQTNDPLRRYKEHNDSSKSTVETRFEFIWRVNRRFINYDKEIHKILKNYGYKNIAKEVFGNSNTKILTIDTILKLFEHDITEGPWKIVNGNLQKTIINTQTIQKQKPKNNQKKEGQQNTKIDPEKQEYDNKLNQHIQNIKSFKNRTEIQKYCSNLNLEELFDYDKTFIVYCLENGIIKYNDLNEKYKKCNLVNKYFEPITKHNQNNKIKSKNKITNYSNKNNYNNNYFIYTLSFLLTILFIVIAIIMGFCNIKDIFLYLAFAPIWSIFIAYVIQNLFYENN